MHRLVARLAWGVHMAFMVFTVLGGFLALLAPWVLIPHLGSALWSARMAVFRSACPLSRLEDWGRSGAGDRRLHERGFVAQYFEDRVYPARWARRVEVGVGTLVVGSWVAISLR